MLFSRSSYVSYLYLACLKLHVPTKGGIKMIVASAPSPVSLSSQGKCAHNVAVSQPAYWVIYVLSSSFKLVLDLLVPNYLSSLSPFRG